MLTQDQAAKYFVLAWCKDWSMEMLLLTLHEIPIGRPNEDGEWPLVQAAHLAYPWLPKDMGPYKKGRKVRQYVGGAFPKLSAWLFGRADDMARLRCAEQVMKLKAPSMQGSLRMLSKEDKAEMQSSMRDSARRSAEYRVQRDSFKTNQRSAWNVCKA